MTSTNSTMRKLTKFLVVGAIAAGSAVGLSGVAQAAVHPPGTITWAQGDGDTKLAARNNLGRAKETLCDRPAELAPATVTRRQDSGFTMRQKIMCT